MMSDEDMAAAIAVALEPLLEFTERLMQRAPRGADQDEFGCLHDAVHLKLMRLLDQVFDAGIKYGMHVEADEHFLLHGGRYES